jgi:hypothetical protein
MGDSLPPDHPVWGPCVELKKMIPPKHLPHCHFYMVELPEEVCTKFVSPTIFDVFPRAIRSLNQPLGFPFSPLATALASTFLIPSFAGICRRRRCRLLDRRVISFNRLATAWQGRRQGFAVIQGL